MSKGEKVDQIPFKDFGGSGEIIHLAHANAYPPGSYIQLIKPLLSKYKVLAMHQRPLWEGSTPKSLKSWELLADDLICFFDQQKLSNIVGMGHSMGGVVSIMAATKRPDLFSKLILIDPVLFPKKVSFMTNLMPIWMRKRFIPIAKLSIKRRDLWDNQQIVYDSFRTKKVFRSFSDTALWDFVKAGTKPNGNGKVTLAYPKNWETQVYITAPSVLKKLSSLTIPVLAIKGQYSNVITSEVWSKWQQTQPNGTFLEYPNSGHLVPMEYPNELAAWILDNI